MDEREVITRFDAHEKLDQQRFGEMNNTLKEMREDMSREFKQLNKKADYTNGKVGENTKYRFILIGGLGVVTTLMVPVLIYLITSHIL